MYVKHKSHTLGGSGGMPPQKCLENSCPETESGWFWQLADYPILVFKIIQHFNTYKCILEQAFKVFFLGGGGGGGGGNWPLGGGGFPRFPTPPCMKPCHLCWPHDRTPESL